MIDFDISTNRLGNLRSLHKHKAQTLFVLCRIRNNSISNSCSHNNCYTQKCPVPNNNVLCLESIIIVKIRNNNNRNLLHSCRQPILSHSVRKSTFKGFRMSVNFNRRIHKVNKNISNEAFFFHQKAQNRDNSNIMANQLKGSSIRHIILKNY